MPPHTLNPTGPNNHIGFDDFFIGSLTVFQIITLEGWVDIMYDVQDAAGVYHCFIFITLVLLGAFLMPLGAFLGAFWVTFGPLVGLLGGSWSPLTPPAVS